MIGKVSPARLAELILGRTGSADERVIQGPAYGEDTAAIDIGTGILVVNTDPISLAVDRIGTLGVSVAANDVAVSGATPEWLTVAVFLPSEDPETLDTITAQLDEAADRFGIAIVGGHSEYAPTLAGPMLVLTCLGLTDRYVRTGGAEPGDRIIMTKAAAIEATAILATDFAELVGDAVDAETIAVAESFYDEIGVLDEAAILREVATAMHDPTEGGLVDGLLELASASGVALEVDPDAIQIRPKTEALCRAAGVDPLRTFGSGALLATVPEDRVQAALGDLDRAGIAATTIGQVTASERPELRLGDAVHTEPVRDDMYALWE